MNSKTIFKALAFAMLMPAMLLTTACSSEDDLVNNTANTENTINKGYALPVTVNVTRGGDATTRATYNETDKVLDFSAGDKLFVYGSTTDAGSFAGALDYVPATGKFSGTIYTESPYEGTAHDLFTAASAGENNLTATLLPNGYDANGSNSFLSINNNSTTDIAYDDRLTVAASKAFVASETAKATGVEQLSLERTSIYSSGFELAPLNAILNFTITGLEAGAQDVSLQIHHGFDYTVTGSVTPTSGVATFAIGVPVGANIKEMDNNLTVGSSNFTLPSSTTFAVGKIYNITRSASGDPTPAAAQFSVSATKKVTFSPGNLQATYNGSSWSWAFAANQWDYIGNAEGNTKVTDASPYVSDYSGSSTTVDLFGWSTEGAENYLGIHYSDDDVCYSGDFVDWGSHTDVIAGIGSGWCTLTKDEWSYLFFTRTVNGGTGIGKSFTLGQNVNNVLGVVLYPDDYTGEPYTTAQSDNWSAFEAAGCVFLPAAGYRDWGAGVYDDGDDGYYWSSSANSDENAHYMYFRSGELPEDTYTSRYCGHSVRLVRPVQ